MALLILVTERVSVASDVIRLLKIAQSRLVRLESLRLDFSSSSCESSTFLTILCPLWFIINSVVFSYLTKLLFSGFLQFL